MFKLDLEKAEEPEIKLPIRMMHGGVSAPSCCAFPHRVAFELIPSAQRLVWAAKQPLGNAALGALFA